MKPIPAERPTASEALAQFRRFRASLAQSTLTKRVWAHGGDTGLVGAILHAYQLVEDRWYRFWPPRRTLQPLQ